MRRRMVLPDGTAARVIDRERQRHADLERALLNRAGMHEQVAGLLLRVSDAEAHAIRAHCAGIANLAAGLAIERRLIEHDRAALARLERGHVLAVLYQRRHHTLGRLGVVTQELGRADLLAQAEPYGFRRSLTGPLPGFARLLALALHGSVKGVGVDRDAARLQRVLRQIKREAKGVIERERGLALDLIALLERARRFIEDRQPALERTTKARLLKLERLGNEGLPAHEFWIGLPHLAHQRRHKLPQQRLLGAKKLGVPHGTPHDSAKHIAAALV